MDDHELLRRYVAQGAQDAFETLVQRYTPLVYGVCQRVLDEAHAAEDAAQATFLTLVRKAAMLARTLGERPLAGWLHVTAHRTALQARRAQTRRHHHERRAGVAAAREAAPTAPETEEEDGSLADAAARIDAAVATLPSAQRDAVLLRYVQGCSQDEVAARLGCSRETVHTHVTRALSTLRGSLKRQGLAVGEGAIAVVMAQGAIPPGLAASIQVACRSLPIPHAVAYLRHGGHGAHGAHGAHAAGIGPGVAVAGTIAAAAVAAIAWAALRAPVAPAPALAPAPTVASQPEPAAPPAQGPPSPTAAAPPQAPVPSNPVPVLEYRGHSQGVTTVVFAPDGARAASGSWDRTLQLWQLSDGQRLEIGEGHHSNVHDVAWAAHADVLATASSDGTAAIWALNPLHVVAHLTAHAGRVLSVAVSPDGGRIATGGLDGTVRLWDAGGMPGPVLTHRDSVWGLAFSPDGTVLASASDDRTVGLWNARTGASIAVLHGHGDCLRTVVFSPDGAHLASGGNDATVRIWSTATDELERTLPQPGMVWRVAYAPDGKLLASCGQWGAQLADAHTGARVGSPGALHPGLQSVAFTNDGRELATAGADGVVRLWRVADLLAHPDAGAAGPALGTGPPTSP